MDTRLTPWLLTCALLGAAFLLRAFGADVAALPAWEAEGIALLRIAGAALVAAAVLGFALRARLTRLLAVGASARPAASPAAQLFWISRALRGNGVYAIFGKCLHALLAQTLDPFFAFWKMIFQMVPANLHHF